MRQEKRRAKAAARKLPRRMQDIAFTKYDHKKEVKRRLKGSYGAAGPCKRICPQTGEVLEVLE